MHCRAALRECSDVPPEETRAFVTGTILPAIDAFNRTQGRGKKMRHPAFLKTEDPSPAAVRRLARKLEVLEEQANAVPANLKSLLIEWVNRHVIDYAPMQKFERDLDRLIKLEADALQLRFWERRAVSNALLTTFTRRRRQRLPFTMGWPKLVAVTDPKIGDWGIHYYLNSAKIQADAILNGGVRGLRLGQPLPPDQTGHPNARGKAFCIRRQFRPAEIAIPDRASGQVWRLEFCILQHQPIPEGAFLKEWKLVQRRGKLQLILVLQVKSSLVPAQAGEAPVAGMDLGWRRDGSGVRVATIFNPVHESYTTLFVDLERKAPHSAARPPYHVFMGPSRRGVRQARASACDGSPGFLDTIDGCRQLRQSRDRAKDRLKSEIRVMLGDASPPWLERAGFRGLASLLQTATDAAVKELVAVWLAQDAPLAALHREYSQRVRARLRKGYEWVAHDVGRMLQADGIRVLAVEERFLAETAQRRRGANAAALRSSMQYRYAVSPELLVRTLDRILLTYGIRITRCSPKNTTRQCHRCGAMNDVGSALQFQCRQCGVVLDQDQNAAVNLSFAVSRAEDASGS